MLFLSFQIEKISQIKAQVGSQSSNVYYPKRGLQWNGKDNPLK